MFKWFKKHFVFHFIGVARFPTSLNKEGKRTKVNQVILMMTDSGRRKAIIMDRRSKQKPLFKYQYDKKIVPWLYGGAFPEGPELQYNQDVLAEVLVKIIDNKLQGQEKFNG